MDAGSIDRLYLRNFEEPSAEHLRTLAAIASRQTKLRGPGIRRRVLPWGTIETYRGRGGDGSTSPVFTPTVTGLGDGSFSVTWQRGTIGGVEPRVGDRPISSGAPFVFGPEAFGATGEALVYFGCHIGADWFIDQIQPFAAAETPATAAWQANKLALIVFDSGRVWRALYSNQGHYAINRRSSGLAQHLFWGKF